MTVVDAAVPVAQVFASALRGDPCLLLDADGPRGLLPTAAWLCDADPVDEALLGLCHGPTVDIGCGPGRMAQALARRGRPVLGIDIVPEAVRLSIDRGVAALLRDVFDPVPGEGRWETALLADGNIGIGGDPVALLSRVRDLIATTGRVVVEVAPPGTGVRTRHVRLETEVGRSDPFPWTLVGADAIAAVAGAAQLRLASQHRYDERFCAVLEVV
ncbi:methyltransferase domain-containing protein [Nocardioides sp.]|jgi:SAM-dependent methyltransferase|uniref:methyltransferase domain-containing protein n=1 Tax=Nocardioides sp. TaxID=35761 RepID=UPI002F40CFEA